MNIDSHHHLWRYDSKQYPWIGPEMPALRRDFWIDELTQLARDQNIDRFVTVQARQLVDETEDLLAAAEICDRMVGVVGWLPIADGDFDAHLERFSGRKRLVGLRHVIQDLRDDDFWMGDAFHRGLDKLPARGLTYDLLIFARQLETSVRFVDKHPDLRIVIDHIAKPTIAADNFDQNWKKHLSEISRRGNVWCKWSGVATEVRDDDWNIETIRPYFDTVLEAFGPERMMFGSDWPVCLLATEYGRWQSVTEQLIAALTPSEQAAIRGGTAAHFYNLPSGSKGGSHAGD
ncbi:MAG: amidohydrolase family protein [Planctomycetota bacterium]